MMETKRQERRTKDKTREHVLLHLVAQIIQQHMSTLCSTVEKVVAVNADARNSIDVAIVHRILTHPADGRERTWNSWVVVA